MNLPVVFFILFLKFFDHNVAEDINDDRNLKDLLIDLDVGEDNGYYYNPNDMLAPPKIPSTAKKKSSFLIEEDEQSVDSCHYENAKLAKCNEKLRDCSTHAEQIEDQLAKEKKKVSLLSSKILDKKNIDVNEFYKRIVHRFWSLLDMESTKEYLRGDSDVATFNLVVKLTLRDIDAFKDYLRGEQTHNQIDLFFSDGFYTTAKEEIQVLHFFKATMNKLYNRFRSFDFWLNLFWLLIIVIGIWGFCLFVADIQRELNWRKVTIMVLVLAFIISFIHQWRYMIKVQEAKRNSMIAEMNVVDYGKATCLEDNSFWFKISSTLFGTRSKCEEYHEKMMIPPNEEVSVGMALMETFTNLILLPLKSCGLHLALFFKNFFTNIPWMFQLPSIFIFMFLFTLILFTVFGYGIHFPFWLGSIRPERPQIDPSDNFKKLIKESEERVERINSLMIKDAKDMLCKVSEIAIAQAQNSSSTYLVEPIVQKCTLIIEKKLEDLVTKRMVNELEYCSSSHNTRKNLLSQLTEDEVDKNEDMDVTNQRISLRPVKVARERIQENSPKKKMSVDVITSRGKNLPSTTSHATTTPDEVESDFMIKLKKIFDEHEN